MTNHRPNIFSVFRECDAFDPAAALADPSFIVTDDDETGVGEAARQVAIDWHARRCFVPIG